MCSVTAQHLNVTMTTVKHGGSTMLLSCFWSAGTGVLGYSMDSSKYQSVLTQTFVLLLENWKQWCPCKLSDLERKLDVKKSVLTQLVGVGKTHIIPDMKERVTLWYSTWTELVNRTRPRQTLERPVDKLRLIYDTKEYYTRGCGLTWLLARQWCGQERDEVSPLKLRDAGYDHCMWHVSTNQITSSKRPVVSLHWLFCHVTDTI